MNTIIFWTIFTAVAAGFFLTCIIEAISTAIKKRKYGKRISIKMYNSSAMWWYIAFAIINGLTAIAKIYGLKYCKFTESVLSKIQIVCYLLIFITFIFAFFLRTRAYITEKGIIISMSFLPVSGVKYSVKKEYDEYIIDLYIKKEKPSYIYCTKKEKAISMLENHYSEFDGSAPDVKFKSGNVKYLLTMLSISLIFVGGIFAWYETQKPVVFVGNMVLKTDWEYAIFDYLGFQDIMLGCDDYKFCGELAERADEMFSYIDITENLTSKDLIALKKMPNLKYLSVYGNNITDLTAIGELTQLEGFASGKRGRQIDNSIPTDYAPLKNLTNLKYFSGLGLNNLSDLTVFENTDGLIYFELTAADIQTGLDVICEKENLAVLKLYLCTAEDFSLIGKCADLKYLSLHSTNVTDLGFLKDLTELEYLDIENVKAEDYSVLLELPKLKKLYAKDTKIPYYIINKLAANGVDVRR